MRRYDLGGDIRNDGLKNVRCYERIVVLFFFYFGVAGALVTWRRKTQVTCHRKASCDGHGREEKERGMKLAGSERGNYCD